MALERLRDKAFFQNTIDVWIAYCEELHREWYDAKAYQSFIRHLNSKGIRMQKFPLCIKESGGMYERGKDKAQFLEELSKISSDDAAAFTLKLSESVLTTIRSFPAA